MSVYYIFQREVRSYFQSLIAYILIAVFLVLAGYFFYSDLIMHILWSFHKTDFGKIWEFYLFDVRYVLMMIIPLLTMRLFAEEKKLGTIELLWTYPIRDWELLAGKYLASLFFLSLMLGLTMVYPLITHLFIYEIDVAALLAGYLGLFLLGSSFIACGLLISSLTENQIVAALGTYGLLLMFWFLTWNEAVANQKVVELLLNISLFDRLLTFTQGAIDLKDVVFFINWHGFFIFLTLLSLTARKWRGIK
ncbi:MAG: ABC transporter permease subunit [Deltaproteobacteria bacterium]|nr:ABC transporter permease subunit [Deltaproteobacteria bacterium]